MSRGQFNVFLRSVLIIMEGTTRDQPPKRQRRDSVESVRNDDSMAFSCSSRIYCVIIHLGHCWLFTSSILCCISAEHRDTGTGRPRWKQWTHNLNQSQVMSSRRLFLSGQPAKQAFRVSLGHRETINFHFADKRTDLRWTRWEESRYSAEISIVFWQFQRRRTRCLWGHHHHHFCVIEIISSICCSSLVPVQSVWCYAESVCETSINKCFRTFVEHIIRIPMILHVFVQSKCQTTIVCSQLSSFIL